MSVVSAELRHPEHSRCAKDLLEEIGKEEKRASVQSLSGGLEK
jgi:hypothetical protein